MDKNNTTTINQNGPDHADVQTIHKESKSNTAEVKEHIYTTDIGDSRL